MGIGDTTPSAALDITKTYSAATAGEEYGARVITVYSLADTGTKQGLRVSTNSSLTSGTQAGVVGVLSIVTGNGNGGTTTTASALTGRVDVSTGHTVNNARALTVSSGLGAGTMDNQFGILVEAMTKGTNNVGIVIGEATGTNQSNLVIGQTTIPTGTFSIYNSSADDNYFAGDVGIGAAPATYKLEVTGDIYSTGDVRVAGDDLFMTTNTTGFLLVADGTNYNPVDVTGDVELTSAGLTTIQANAVALTTDTSGNYVAGLTEGNYIDVTGAAGEGWSPTVAFDPTEMGTVTWYNGTAATDIIWTFDGETNDGTFGYYEDEDAFSFTNSLVGVGTTAPTALLDLQQAGTAKANTDIVEITNSGNALDMDATGTSILFNQWYYDAVTPAVADAGRITIGTETDWTSTVTTQDSYLSLSTAVNGTVAEKVRIDSLGNMGIGTTTPGSSFPADWSSNTTNDRLLEIKTQGAAYNSGLFLRRSDQITGLDLWSNNSSGNSYIDNRYNNAAGTIFFRLRGAGTAVNALTIIGSGASSSRVGIGVIAPQSAMDIEGNLTVGATYSGTNAAPTNGLLVENQIIIASTSASAYKLHVAGGDSYFGGDINIAGDEEDNK